MANVSYYILYLKGDFATLQSNIEILNEKEIERVRKDFLVPNDYGDASLSIFYRNNHAKF